MPDIRAEVDKAFIRRFLFISIGCFLFMLWGLYDAVVTKPKDLERSHAYVQLANQQAIGEITEAERAEKWDTMTAENGWESTKPESPENARRDIWFQWFLFALGLLLGIFFLIKYLRLLNSWMKADELGVETSWGQNLKFENIQGINKRKWPKKGIARVDYKDESGAIKTMIFDDFKYHRESMGEIMKLAEAGLSDDQIVGDIRESEKPVATNDIDESNDSKKE